MTNQVKVITGQDGQVLQQNPNKPGFMFFQVESSEGISLQGGFLRGARKAIITLASNLADAAKAAFPNGKLIPGKIVVKETRTPQWEGHTVCINPTTNTPALRNGSPYYRSAKYTENINEMDELIPSDASVVAAPAIQLGFPQRQF